MESPNNSSEALQINEVVREINVKEELKDFKTGRGIHIPYILNGELYKIETQDGENVTVKCCNCPPDRVYRGSVRSTGNFHMHIKRRHPDLLGRLHDMKVNALLERRDRLMKNRKFCTRGVPGGSMKRECTPPPNAPVSSTSFASQIQRHNFKLEAAFKRHQQQNQLEGSTHNWCLAPFVVISRAVTTTTSEVQERPINLSLKESQPHLGNSNGDEHSRTVVNSSSVEGHVKNVHNCDVLSTISRPYLHNTNNRKEQSTFENGDAVVGTSYSSNASSNSCSIESNLSPYNSNHCKSISGIKKGREQALDLSVQTVAPCSSGIGSEDSSCVGTTALSYVNQAEFTQSRGNEVLCRLELALSNIRHEMRTRNEIESNRMFLDVAKFKYLNPGFVFNLNAGS